MVAYFHTMLCCLQLHDRGLHIKKAKEATRYIFHNLVYNLKLEFEL